MKISIASGKGGTGKTTVAVNLSLIASEKKDLKVALLDCDVEAPNDNLFLNTKFDKKEDVNILLPWIDEAKCNGCGLCSEVCAFNAIAIIKTTKKVLIFPELCHSCGACGFFCPQKAIYEVEKKIGVIEQGRTLNLKFVSGEINTGEILSPVIIRKEKKLINDDELTIIDAPPGTSCTMVNSVLNSDLCILVTEPTPFGLYDLSLSVDLLRKLNIPFCIIINKNEKEKKIIDEYCNRENIEIIGRIPFDRKIASLYSTGLTIIIEPEYKKLFEKILENVLRRLE